MQNKTKYLVTAALPYANNYVHIGHLAGAYLPPDIYVRYRKLKGDDVIFISGSDEHGTAIDMAAIQEKVTPQEIIDRYHFSNKKAFEDIGIEFDIFSRTSNKIHHETAQEFFLNLYNKNILVQKTEKQLYSEKEKRFLADRFVTGTCPVCGNTEARGDECEVCGSNLSPLELIDPRSKITGDIPVVKDAVHLYFPLGRYQENISKWIFSKEGWKQNVINYVKGWIKAGLRDRAVTRDLDWGVKVPVEGNDGKVIYVWFEAPIGYISATKEYFIGKNEPDKWKEYWKGDNTRLIHFIGKDNIVFHSLIFPAALMAHGDYVLPYNVPANEFLNISGAKLSKSKKNGILLKDIVQKFPPDVVRYAIASILPESKDSEFSWKDLQTKNNSELAGILGNFINRTVVFAKTKFDNVIPERKDDDEILKFIKSQTDNIAVSYDEFRLKDALSETMNIVRAANKYFNDTEPWKLVKDEKEKCGEIINNCLQICYSIAILINPFLPFTSEKILKILSADKTNFKWDRIGEINLASGNELGENQILFPQIEDSQIENEMGTEITNDSKEENKKIAGDKTGTNLIGLEDFKKVNLKVAKILECEVVPKSKKLLKLKLKVGDKEKQIVSGISEHYKPEDLIGKLIVVVDNLKPSKLMGIDSEGMLLAAKKDGELKLVLIDGEIEPGAEVS
ncbi:MAG: methionine--tRNA ligase [Ignavibacteria bacterium]|jgi:methionyl-tRNA synthetase|nr:methionine--tRNA ligase [Ignavibacteria bacterium]